jgi:hypothetical protein
MKNHGSGMEDASFLQAIKAIEECELREAQKRRQRRKALYEDA